MKLTQFSSTKFCIFPRSGALLFMDGSLLCSKDDDVFSDEQPGSNERFGQTICPDGQKPKTPRQTTLRLKLLHYLIFALKS